MWWKYALTHATQAAPTPTPVKNFVCPSDMSGIKPDGTSDGSTGVAYNLTSYAANCVVFFGMYPSLASNFTDGTGNTMLIGEKRLRPENMGKAQSHDDQGFTSGWDRDEVCWGIVPPEPDRRGQDGFYQFGSAHPGGFNAVYCDGSVHVITYNIQSNNTPTSSNPLGIWQRLCKRDDGLTLGDVGQ